MACRAQLVSHRTPGLIWELPRHDRHASRDPALGSYRPQPQLLLLQVLHLRGFSILINLHGLHGHNVFQHIFRLVAFLLVFLCNDLLAGRMHEEQPLFAQSVPVWTNSEVDAIVANAITITTSECALVLGNLDRECCGVDNGGWGLADAAKICQCRVRLCRETWDLPPELIFQSPRWIIDLVDLMLKL